MAVVIGGLALVLDASIRGTVAPATLRSPWWRAAIGASPLALAAWAFSDAAGVVCVAIGIALGLGLTLGNPLLALAAIPAIVLAPVALRLVIFAVDTFYPSAFDRRSVTGAADRGAVVTVLTSAMVALALVAGAHGGAYAGIATLTAQLLVVVTAAVRCCASWLPAAVE
jgi:hypothetical protein